jgi:TadE-like protein
MNGWHPVARATSHPDETACPSGRRAGGQVRRIRGWAGRRRGRRPAEAGNAALELVILTPVLILLISMVIAAGRISIAQGSVDAAARDAARQASLARSPSEAQATALATATAQLGEENLDCKPSVSLGALDAAFATPLGQPASVTVTIRCRVSLSGLVLRGLPGHVPLHYSFTSPLDPFRGRTLGLGPARLAVTPASGGA